MAESVVRCRAEQDAVHRGIPFRGLAVDAEEGQPGLAPREDGDADRRHEGEERKPPGPPGVS